MKAIRNSIIVFAAVIAVGVVALTGCGGSSNSGGGGGGSVASVSVSANPTSVQVGKTSQLTVNVACSGTCDQSYTLSADYGTISGTVYTAPSSVPSGSTATITASASGKTGTATITITAAPAVSISAISGTTIPQVGVKYAYTATVTNPIGTNVSMTWYSSDSSVVSIDPATGMATAEKTGSATITATAAADTSKTSSVKVNVRDWILAVSSVDSGMYLLDATNTNQPVHLTSLPTGCLIRSFSFDRLSFTCTLGSKIYVYTTDGTAAGTVLAHTVETGLYSADSASFSPDGKHLLYMATAIQTDNSLKEDIYTSALDGTGQQLLESQTLAGVGPDAPHYSPDGTKILWHQVEGGTEYIGIMDADGTNQERLLSTPAADGIWSADGTKIFYFDLTSRGIYSMDANGTGEQLLVSIGTPTLVSVPQPSADGVRMVYWNNNALKIADTATGAYVSTLNFTTTSPLAAW
jgi:hypothetical protein